MKPARLVFILGILSMLGCDAIEPAQTEQTTPKAESRNQTHEEAAKPAFTLSGKVSNESGMGVAGVAVELLKGGSKTYHTISDSTGKYSITGISEGAYEAQVNKSLYIYPSTGEMTGVDSKFEGRNEPLAFGPDATKDFILLYRTYELAEFDLSAGKIVRRHEKLRVRPSFLELADSAAALLQDLANDDLLELHLASGQTEVLLAGKDIGCSLTSLAYSKASQTFAYACDGEERKIEVTLFSREGKKVKSAAFEKPGLFSSVKDGAFLASNGRDIFISSTESEPLVPSLGMYRFHQSIHVLNPASGEVKELLGSARSPHWGYGYPRIFDDGDTTIFSAALGLALQAQSWSIFRIGGAGYEEYWKRQDPSLKLVNALAAAKDGLFISHGEDALLRVSPEGADSISLGRKVLALKSRSPARMLILLDQPPPTTSIRSVP